MRGRRKGGGEGGGGIFGCRRLVGMGVGRWSGWGVVMIWLLAETDDGAGSWIYLRCV